jgi:hypothetical protein
MVARKVGPPRQRKVLMSAVPVQRSSNARHNPGKIHAHRCVDCGLRYEDPCWEPRTNGSCGCTLEHHTRPVWLRDRDPKDCCRLYSRLITDVTELEKYALAGNSDWWQCQHCFRSHPNNPTE